MLTFGSMAARLAYAKADFDILIVTLLDDADRLKGIFVFPSSVLARREFIGHKPRRVGLYPPWARPKRPATSANYSWQLDYFVDLRSWRRTDLDLDPSTKARFNEVLLGLKVQLSMS